MPGTAPALSVVIVTYNAPEWTRRCLDSIAARTREPHEVVVVDNASGEETRRLLAERAAAGAVRLLQNEDNRLWAAGCNQGIAATDARSPLVLLLNPDCEVLADDWLARMRATLDRDPTVAVTGPYTNWKRLAPVYGSLDGSCFLVRRAALEVVGLLDAERYPWNGSEPDWAARAYARGWIYRRTANEPPFLVHHKHKSQEASGNILPYRRVDHREIVRRAGLAPRQPHRLAVWLRRRFGPPFFFEPDAPAGAR